VFNFFETIGKSFFGARAENRYAAKMLRERYIYFTATVK